MIWIVLGLSLVGICLSAFFSGCETGFYRAVRLRLALDALGGDPIARGLLFLTNHPALFVATTLVGTSLANYLVSLSTVIGVRTLFAENPQGAEFLATLVLSPFLLIYGELLPKSLFLQAPNRLLRRGGGALLLFTVLLFPIAGLLWGLGRLLGRLVHDSSEPVRLVLAQRELRRVLEEGHEAGILYPAQRSLAQGILAVARLPVTKFLTPLSQVPAARSNMTKQEVLRLAQRTHWALIPVESSDASATLIGYVRVIDLRLSDSDDLRPLRPLLELSGETTHLVALMRMESMGESLAQVIGAQGETAGIITIEQLREPLF